MVDLQYYLKYSIARKLFPEALYVEKYFSIARKLSNMREIVDIQAEEHPGRKAKD